MMRRGYVPPYALPWPMALRAEPALNQLIWLSLKVWFTGNSYVSPSGFLPTTVRGLPGWKSVRPLTLILSNGPICGKGKAVHSRLQYAPCLQSIILAGADCGQAGQWQIYDP